MAIASVLPEAVPEASPGSGVAPSAACAAGSWALARTASAVPASGPSSPRYFAGGASQVLLLRFFCPPLALLGGPWGPPPAPPALTPSLEPTTTFDADTCAGADAAATAKANADTDADAAAADLHHH